MYSGISVVYVAVVLGGRLSLFVVIFNWVVDVAVVVAADDNDDDDNGKMAGTRCLLPYLVLETK